MNTNNENNEILFSQLSFRKDTFIKVVHRKDIDVVEFIIEEQGNQIAIPFNLSLFNLGEKNMIDNKELVLNNVNRANVIGRGCTVLKNFLKTTMFKKLLDAGEIDQSEYEMRMGKLLEKVNQ